MPILTVSKYLMFNGDETMTVWVTTLNLSDVWKDQNEEGIVDTVAIAEVICNRLPKLDNKLFDEFTIQERDIIVDDFLNFFENGDNDIEEFDYLMGNLYDWADGIVGETEDFFNRKKRCWVKTSF